MPRKGAVPKRDVNPDPLYNNKMVTRFVNKLMYDGQKEKARNILYQSFDVIKEKTGQDPLEVFEAAIQNVSPVLEVKPRRVGGATYQVPVEVSPRRKVILSIRWLITFSRKRSERTMAERLANEIIDAANSTGNSFKKKEDTHKMAEANKAFAHYRW